MFRHTMQAPGGVDVPPRHVCLLGHVCAWPGSKEQQGKGVSTGTAPQPPQPAGLYLWLPAACCMRRSRVHCHAYAAASDAGRRADQASCARSSSSNSLRSIAFHRDTLLPGFLLTTSVYCDALVALPSLSRPHPLPGHRL
jgi:hypothetical protein